jgi:putative transport protein
VTPHRWDEDNFSNKTPRREQSRRFWALGYHLFKINPAVLMDGVAGARSHSGPAREAAAEIGSSAPWIGFPVGYAVSGILLTVFGYCAVPLAQ